MLVPLCLYCLVVHTPATPQRPNPELRIVDPLLISATAASASLNSLEPPRSILGARDRNGVAEYLVLVLVLNNAGHTLARTARNRRGRQTPNALRDKVAVAVLKTVMLIIQGEYITERKWDQRAIKIFSTDSSGLLLDADCRSFFLLFTLMSFPLRSHTLKITYSSG